MLILGISAYYHDAAATIIKDGKISSSYNIKENKYNIKLLEKYLEKEDVIND